MEVNFSLPAARVIRSLDGVIEWRGFSSDPWVADSGTSRLNIGEWKLDVRWGKVWSLQNPRNPVENF